MRGKGLLSRIYLNAMGITPAYAGKRLLNAPPIASPTDHPRLCGEKLSKRAMISLQKGSPPPMRGKAHTRGVAPQLIGITPAYAGKRNLNRKAEKARKDHPRLCGEKAAFGNSWKKI